MQAFSKSARYPSSRSTFFRVDFHIFQISSCRHTRLERAPNNEREQCAGDAACSVYAEYLKHVSNEFRRQICWIWHFAASGWRRDGTVFAEHVGFVEALLISALRMPHFSTRSARHSIRRYGGEFTSNSYGSR